MAYIGLGVFALTAVVVAGVGVSRIMKSRRASESDADDDDDL
jgi:hypothetical protein